MGIKTVSSCHVETIVLLGRKNDPRARYLEIPYEPGKDVQVREHASYREIKEWVLQQFGMKVSSLYIAQVKRKNGIIEHEDYNPLHEGGDRKGPVYQPEKEEARNDALKWYGMIA